MTLNDGGYDRRDGLDRRTMAILLALLLLLLIVFAWIYRSDEEVVVKQPTDGSFRTTFQGCDRAGRCAEFRIVAPGYDYRWTFDSVDIDPVNGVEPDLLPVVQNELRGARAVIAAGLASREGGDEINRQLSACRSKRLAALLESAQSRIGTRVPSYRIALGRYQDATLTSGGRVVEGEDTSIERLVVMAFVLDFERGLNINEALKDGLLKALPSALADALGPIRRQLDFTRYACWQSEFQVTPADQVRDVCYDEPSADVNSFCSSF